MVDARILAAVDPRDEHADAQARIKQDSKFSSVARCPEIDCIRRWFSRQRLSEVEQRADDLNIGADEVLLATGEIAPDPYFHAQAAALGIDFIDLDKLPRSLCPLGDESLFAAARTGLLPVLDGFELRWAVAKPGLWMRSIARTAGNSADIRRRFMITTPQRFRRFVERHTIHRLHDIAAQQLPAARPDFSAARPTDAAFPLVGLVTVFGLCWLAPQLTANTLLILLSTLFIIAGGQRLWLLRPVEQRLLMPTENLPTYTIIAALYRETKVLPSLVAALDAIEYPREKLQIILALEPDDYAMRDAVAKMSLGFAYEVVLASMPAPRGKPKALNAALQYVRGDYIAVFDAEDKPEPRQLREVATIFANDRDEAVACVQARLTIDNSGDGWLASVFTAEYAGHFDVMLPALAARGMPIPLGGSSTHVRTNVIREVGAWDAHNVTEDADLGIRLARHGYRTAVGSSSTYEEAPARPVAWIKQRTRWFKGWMQTWAVHARHPAELVQQLGLRNAASLHLYFFGIVFSVLAQPLAWLFIVAGFIAPELLRQRLGSLADTFFPYHVAALLFGYAVSIAVKLEGLRRRDLLTWRSGALLVVRLPAYWALLSLAAWRALGQFFFNRYHWEKTEHGLARTSRRAQR